MNPEKLPKGWEWRELGEVCEKPEYGYTTSAKKDGTGPLFLRTTDISEGEINWQSVPFCAESPTEEERYRLKDGDLLISRAGSVGAAVVVRNPPRSIFASYLIRFRPKKELNPLYAGFFLKSNIYWSQLGGKTGGTTLPGVNAKNLSKLRIPLPPLPTQRRIVAILEKADTLRRKRRLADEKTSRILQAAFVKMFGEPVRNEMGWEVVKLGEMTECLDSMRIPIKESERNKRIGDIPYYGANGQVGWIDDHLFDETLLLLAEDGGFWGPGEKSAYIIKGKSWVNNHAHVLRAHDLATLYFLETFFNISDLRKYISGTTRGKLIQQDMKRIELPLPPLSLQRKFATLVERVEAMRERQAKSREKIENTFQALMQKAFRGELVA